MPVPAPQAPRSGAQRRHRRLSRGAAVSLEFKSALLHLTSKSPLELADSGGPGDRPGGPGRPQAAARAPLASCLRFCIKCFCIESNSTLERLIHDTSKIATPKTANPSPVPPPVPGATVPSVTRARPRARWPSPPPLPRPPPMLHSSPLVRPSCRACRRVATRSSVLDAPRRGAARLHGSSRHV